MLIESPDVLMQLSDMIPSNFQKRI